MSLNNTFFMTAVFLVLMVSGLVILSLILYSRRKRSNSFQNQFGPEYDHTVQNLGDEKKAQTELEMRQKHIEELNIHSLSENEQARYRADWAAVQTKFIDEPGKAIVEADHLIMEVMQLRAYPVSDFEQRAADISVNYPELVTNYRAARLIANKNKHQQANTEELRQAMIYYRSLFEELLETETVV